MTKLKKKNLLQLDQETQVNPDVEVLPELHLENLLGRIVLEYKILKASTRHFAFAVSYIVSLFCIAVSTENTSHVAAHSIIENALRFDQLSNISSIDEHADWVNSYLSILPNVANSTSPIVSVGSRVTYVSKYLLSECGEGVHAFLNTTDLCLSESDSIVVGTVCRESICPSFCHSAEEKPFPFDCLYLNSSVRAEYSTKALVVENIPNLIFTNTFLISSIRSRIMVYVPSEDMIGSVDVSHVAGASTRQVFLYSPRDLTLTYRTEFIVGFLFALISILIDGKNVLKKFRQNRLSFWNFVKHLNSLSIAVLLATRWYLLQIPILSINLEAFLAGKNLSEIVTIFNNLDSFSQLEMLLNTFCFILICFSSVRFFRILSFHPKSKLLSSIGRIGRKDWILLSLVCLVLTVYYSALLWVVVDSHSGFWVHLYSVIQIPFGVWPFTAENQPILVCYGLLVFYYFLSLLQILVAKHYQEYRAKHVPVVALGVVQDIYEFVLVALKRGRDFRVWPNRIVLICALERILAKKHRNSQHQFISFSELLNEMSEKTANQNSRFGKKLYFLKSKKIAIDKVALETMWRHYAVRFEFLTSPSKTSFEYMSGRVDEIYKSLQVFNYDFERIRAETI